MRLNCPIGGVVFPFGIWGLWLHRNSIVFNRERPQNDLKREVMAKATEFAFLGANDRPGGHRTTIKINWHRPSENWVKLNTDGSSIGNPDLVGGGGLIHNAR